MASSLSQRQDDGIRDLRHDVPLDDLLAEIPETQAGEGQTQFSREIAGQGFHLTHHLRGKNRGVSPHEGGPAGRAGLRGSSVSATCSR